MDYYYAYLSFVEEKNRVPHDFTVQFPYESAVTRRDRRRNLTRKGLMGISSHGSYFLTGKGKEFLAKARGEPNKFPIQTPSFSKSSRFSSSFKREGVIHKEKAKEAVIQFLKENGPASAKVIARSVGLSEAWALRHFPTWVAGGFLFHNGKDRSASRYYVTTEREMDIPELQENQEALKIQALVAVQEPQVPSVKDPFWWLPFNGSFILLREKTPVGVVSEGDWMAYSPMEAAGKARNPEDGMKIISILAGAL